MRPAVTLSIVLLLLAIVGAAVFQIGFGSGPKARPVVTTTTTTTMAGS